MLFAGDRGAAEGFVSTTFLSKLCGSDLLSGPLQEEMYKANVSAAKGILMRLTNKLCFHLPIHQFSELREQFFFAKLNFKRVREKKETISYKQI